MDPSKAVVTVSRLWNHPQIYTTITQQSIGLHMSLADFLTAVEHELTTYPFNKAVERVVAGIKAESTKVT